MRHPLCMQPAAAINGIRINAECSLICPTAACRKMPSCAARQTRRYPRKSGVTIFTTFNMVNPETVSSSDSFSAGRKKRYAGTSCHIVSFHIYIITFCFRRGEPQSECPNFATLRVRYRYRQHYPLICCLPWFHFITPAMTSACSSITAD